MFSLVPGLVFGDWMCGMVPGQIFMRLTGFIALGVLPMQGGFSHVYFFRMLNFALWSSLVPDWMGYYPMGYLYGVWMIQGILWWGIAAPAKREGLKPVGSLLVVPGGLLLLHIFFSAPAFFPIPQLGAHSGQLIRILSGFLLLPPFVIHVLNTRTHRERKSKQWSHLAS